MFEGFEMQTTIAFTTLGCKVNQVETEQFKEAFNILGYQVVSFEQKADIYIINTCTVTHVSDRKSRSLVRRAARLNPGAWLVVTGCMAQILAEQVAQIAPVHLIIGNGRKDSLPQIVHEAFRAEAGMPPSEPKIMMADSRQPEPLATICYQKRHLRTRAFVKIEDGCESFCTFCIVPQARGRVRSKCPENILKELIQLVSLGYSEAVLTGIHIGQYGADLVDWNLASLLRYLLDNLPVSGFSIRLGSIEPLEISASFRQLIAVESRICRHFHIPLQSGSKAILKAMHRRYSPEDYRELIFALHEDFPDAALAADVMIGFPGETDEDFQATYDLIADLPLTDLHVFKYSRRPGTPASNFPDQISEAVKNVRSDILLKLAQNKKKTFLEKFIGRSIEVLVEQIKHDQQYLGISDNYIEVEIISEKKLSAGEKKVVYCTEVQEEKILGRIV